MSTTNWRAALLAVCTALLCACAGTNAQKNRVGAEPVHELPMQQTGAPSAAPAPQSTSPATKAAADVPARGPSKPSDWPLLLTSEGTTFSVHQPVVDNLTDGILTGRAVVVAQPQPPAQPVHGSVTIKALAEVDSASGIASLVDTEVLGVSFPDNVDQTQAWHEFLRFAVPPKITSLPAAAVESGRSIAQARQSAAATEITAPRIIVSERPALLIYIDGNPRYVPVKGTTFMGVLNTRVLLLKDSAETYYLHLYDGWVSAPSLNGPWTIASNRPEMSELEQAARASGRVNLLRGRPDSAGNRPMLGAAPLPDILVALQPTALIVLDGPPRYAPVSGTSLVYAVNTSARLFGDAASGYAYVQVDRSWFRAPYLSGPWSHVPQASLPSDFSAIPGAVPSAGDSNIVAADRRTATLRVSLAGDPVLKPIRGTQLNYVANASVPVIQIDINNWYAVQNGVWFYATEATGPWTVTDRVPPEIYSIPPGVPIYHAIHSRVMASSSDVTYYGYPGAGSHVGGGGAIGVEDEGSDYQYTPPSGMYWGWVF